jgi:hypothetical protein
MHRHRIPLLMLLFLAACAPHRAAPSLASVPTPSYTAILDGGRVSPITTPIVLKFTPFDAASFEQIVHVTGEAQGRTVTEDGRSSGRVYATQENDLVAVTYVTEEDVPEDDSNDPELDWAWAKGSRLTLVVDPFGSLQDVRLTLPSSLADGAKAKALARQLKDKLRSRSLRPRSGIRQGDGFRTGFTPPSTARTVGRVQGHGPYRGRPVIVANLTLEVTSGDQLISLSGYAFVDIQTGILSHAEAAGAATVCIRGQAARITVHAIDDVRF